MAETENRTRPMTPQPPLIEPPNFWRILAVMAALVAVPLVLLLAEIPSGVALPLIAVSAIVSLVYGGYWTMRIIHVDRANARRQW